MEDFPILYALATGLSFIVAILLCIAGIVCYAKFRSPQSMLLLVGGLLVFGSHGFQFLGPLLAARAGSDTLIRMTGITGIVSGFSYLVFALGLILFIISLKKKITE